MGLYGGNVAGVGTGCGCGNVAGIGTGCGPVAGLADFCKPGEFSFFFIIILAVIAFGGFGRTFFGVGI